MCCCYIFPGFTYIIWIYTYIDVYVAHCDGIRRDMKKKIKFSIAWIMYRFHWQVLRDIGSLAIHSGSMCTCTMYKYLHGWVLHDWLFIAKIHYYLCQIKSILSFISLFIDCFHPFEMKHFGCKSRSELFRLTHHDEDTFLFEIVFLFVCVWIFLPSPRTQRTTYNVTDNVRKIYVCVCVYERLSAWALMLLSSFHFLIVKWWCVICHIFRPCDGLI